MTPPADGSLTTSPQDRFLDDVRSGLARSPKSLSPKYFYDEKGSLLFDAICELPEYYPTRIELAILKQHASAIAEACGESLRLVEPGAGSGTKTRVLLRAMGRHALEYVPVDVAREHLETLAAQLRQEFPLLRVAPLVMDFGGLTLPPSDRARRTVVFFPGSTIGNFEPADASRLLARFRRVAGSDGLVIVGVDLKKDPARLHAAYNDAQGITAAFNKNILVRMNKELGTDFDVGSFHHYAFYEPIAGRVEMHLVSARAQCVTLGGRKIAIAEGESICTEHSYKYDLTTVETLAREAGLRLAQTFMDETRAFGLLLFHVG